MKRLVSGQLEAWLASGGRRPTVLRGAAHSRRPQPQHASGPHCLSPDRAHGIRRVSLGPRSGPPRREDRCLAPWESLTAALRGQLAEQVAGQQLRPIDTGAGDGPELFFWKREGGRPGEVDYVAQIEARIVPVELKAGAAGSMKSLHQFMFDKQLDLAVRGDTNPPSLQDIQMRTTRGDAVRYRLVGVPLYLLWNLAPIVADCLPRRTP